MIRDIIPHRKAQTQVLVTKKIADMKKRNFKSLTNNVIAKQLTFQVVGGITDPNDDDNPPRNTGGSSSGNNDTRHNSSSQGANSSTGN